MTPTPTMKPRTKGETRQMLRRFVNLGLIASWAQDDSLFEVVTNDGETWRGTTPLVSTFLDGIGHASKARKDLDVDEAFDAAVDRLIAAHEEQFAALLAEEDQRVGEP